MFLQFYALKFVEFDSLSGFSIQKINSIFIPIPDEVLFYCNSPRVLGFKKWVISINVNLGSKGTIGSSGTEIMHEKKQIIDLAISINFFNPRTQDCCSTEINRNWLIEMEILISIKINVQPSYRSLLYCQSIGFKKWVISINVNLGSKGTIDSSGTEICMKRSK